MKRVKKIALSLLTVFCIVSGVFPTAVLAGASPAVSAQAVDYISAVITAPKIGEAPDTTPRLHLKPRGAFAGNKYHLE